MKKYILLCLIFILSSCKSQKGGFLQTDLSKQIYKVQKGICGDKNYLKVFERNRGKVTWMQDIEKMNNDTVYLLEEHYYSNEVMPFQYKYSALFWNKKTPEIVDSYFQEEGKKIKYKFKHPYDKYRRNIVNDWGALTKTSITQKDNVVLGGDHNTIITRIINKDGKKEIEAIYLKWL